MTRFDSRFLSSASLTEICCRRFMTFSVLLLFLNSSPAFIQTTCMQSYYTICNSLEDCVLSVWQLNKVMHTLLYKIHTPTKEFTWIWLVFHWYLHNISKQIDKYRIVDKRMRGNVNLLSWHLFITHSSLILCTYMCIRQQSKCSAFHI